MPLYQNGYKRPYIYKVTNTNEMGVSTTTNYSVLQSFSYYDEITMIEYVSLTTEMAKQRMDDFIIYINQTYYSGETPTINQSFYDTFDIYDTDTCEITIPEDILPPSVEKQDICLSSEIVEVTEDQVGIKWSAYVFEGLAFQEIQVPIQIIRGSTVISEEIIIIPENTQTGSIDTIYYDREESDYNLIGAFNLLNNDPQFNVGGECNLPEETVPALNLINTLFIHIPTL
ncbi:MAG: hypothetical protein ACOCVF_00265 [bacterium]